MKWIALALAVLAASPAEALSVRLVCDPAEATIPNAFHQFDGFAAEVVMAVGHLRPGAVIYEEVYGAEGELALRRFAGSFAGKSATAAGFTAPFSARVTIEQRCEGAACFPSFDESQWLVFLQKTGDGYLFEVSENYCGPSGFMAPSAADLDLAITCLNGGCR